jgi:ABC-type branched-subunit amino acid transport system substrate-binding protein
MDAHRASNLRLQAALASAFALASSAAMSATPAPAAKEPIKVGWVTELSGPWHNSGEACLAALDIARDEINSTGGANGHPLEFIVKDDATDRPLAVQATKELDQAGVVVVSGPTSSDAAEAIHGYVEAQHLPFVAPVAASLKLTTPGTRWTFRMEPDANGWGYAMAKFVEDRHPGAKVGILYSNFAATSSAATGFRAEAKRGKLDILMDTGYPRGTTTGGDAVAKLKAMNPDYVFVFGDGQGKDGFDQTLTGELLAAGFKPDQLLHPHGSATQILAWGAPSVGSYYGTFFDAGIDTLSPAAHTFLDKVKAKTGRDGAYIENNCYVTAHFLREAIAKSGNDRKRLQATLRKIDSKELTTGLPIRFDADGARREYMYVMQTTAADPKSYRARQVFYTEWDAKTALAGQ